MTEQSDDGYTWCDKCEYSNRHGPSYSWTCRMFKRKEGFGFVTRSMWDRDEPFMRCKDINGGECPVYSELKHDLPS